MTTKLILDPLANVDPPSKLRILSIEDLAQRLGYSNNQIEKLAEHAGRYYHPFDKKTRARWFAKKASSSKRRIIDNPQGELKKIQKRIHDELLIPITFPYYLCGGVKGRDVIHNVSMHLGAKIVVTIDIRDFFPSIHPAGVFRVWKEVLGCSQPVARTLTKLTTFNRHLPQGAPTSTLLANLVIYSVDAPIREACKRAGVQYSTWVDDLALSGDAAPAIIQAAVEALRAAGFTVSHRKLRVMGPGGRQILNGVLLGRFPGIVRERANQLRSGIHKLRIGNVSQPDRERYVRSLQGSIRHLESIVPRRGRKLRDEFDAVLELIAVGQDNGA